MIFPGVCQILCNLALANVSSLPPPLAKEHSNPLFLFWGPGSRFQGLCTCHFCYLECSSPPASGDWLLLILHMSAYKSPPQVTLSKQPYLNFPHTVSSASTNCYFTMDLDTAGSQSRMILPSEHTWWCLVTVLLGGGLPLAFSGQSQGCC